jgi:predicted nucleic acid-binding protein
MTRWVVVDTNVLVSGVFGAGKETPPQRIVAAMLAGMVRFLVSEELVFEYRRVLLLPGILLRHGLDEAEVDEFLGCLLEHAAIRKAPIEVRETDDRLPVPRVSGDEHIIALLRTEPRAVLVTGDRILAEAIGSWREVHSPAELAAALDAASAG